MFKKGDKVVKVISIMGSLTGSYHYVVGENKNKGYISIADEKDGEPWGHYDGHAYHQETGISFEDVIPGCSSMIVSPEQAKKLQVTIEQ